MIVVRLARLVLGAGMSGFGSLLVVSSARLVSCYPAWPDGERRCECRR